MMGIFRISQCCGDALLPLYRVVAMSTLDALNTVAEMLDVENKVYQVELISSNYRWN